VKELELHGVREGLSSLLTGGKGWRMGAKNVFFARFGGEKRRLLLLERLHFF
jgi:hypothetical protein